MNRRLFLSTAAALAAAGPVRAVQPFTFPSIDGGLYNMADWAGRPVLVVNTASLCGFTGQYDGLQRLQDSYNDQGLVVLAVPSNDFDQELGSEADVAEFCEMHFGLTLPMTTIQHVRGARAHPFYRWLAASHGFVPQWNFNKVLLTGAGEVAGTWGSRPEPMGRRIRNAVEAQLSA